MLWKVKNLLGTSLQLLLQLLPQLLNFFAKILKSNAMKLVEKWSFEEGEFKLVIPDHHAYFIFSNDRSLSSNRGSLSILEWISSIFRFISVYRKMFLVNGLIPPSD